MIHLADSSRITCASFTKAGSSSGSSSSGSGGMSGHGSGSGSGSVAGSILDSASSSCTTSPAVASADSGPVQGSSVIAGNSAATVIVPIGTGAAGSGEYHGGVSPLASPLASPHVTDSPGLSALASSEPTHAVAGGFAVDVDHDHNDDDDNCSTITILTTVSTEHGGSIYTISGAIIQSTSSTPTMAAFTIVDHDETYTSLSTFLAPQTVTFTSNFDIVSTGLVPVTTTVAGQTTGVNIHDVAVTQTMTLVSEGETVTITTISTEGAAQALSNSILGEEAARTVYTTTDDDGDVMTITSDVVPTAGGATNNTLLVGDGQTLTDADATLTQDAAGNTILETPATSPGGQLTVTDADATITDGDVVAQSSVVVQTDNSAATMAAGAGAGVGAFALAVMLL